MDRDACEKLEILLKSSQSLITCETVEEDRLRALVRISASNTNMLYYDWSVVEGLKLNGQIVVTQTLEPIDCLQRLPTIREPSVFLMKDMTPHLQTPTLTRLFREVATSLANPMSSIILCAPQIALAPELAHLAVPFELSFPSRAEIRSLISSVVTAISQAKKIKVEITAPDLEALISSMTGLTLRQARQILTYSILVTGALNGKDIELVLQKKAELMKSSGVLEFYPPSTKPLELGGFAGLKEWLATAALAFSPDAQKLNIPAPKGVMLVGVPGCGKSLCAKIIAKTWRQPLVRLDAAKLFDKYIGGTERNFQRATEIVEAMAPCVFWIDEIEKMMTPQSEDSADGGVGQRLFGAFLTWLQEKKDEVFLVATSNDISRLPPELLRKGRFDEIFFVDLPTLPERVQIIGIQIKAHNLDAAALSVPQLSAITEGFSGAEIEQLFNSSILKCLRDKCSLSFDLLQQEAKILVPLSKSRAADIDQLRAIGKSQFRPAS